jgi:diacylglycerol kinase (ATP)
MARVLVLISAKSRTGAGALEKVKEELALQGHQVLNTEEHKNDPDPNEIILKYQDEVDTVIVGGGDGSVNLSLPALMETKKPLLVIPLGTANNLARTYALPTDIKELVKLLKEGSLVEIDLATVNGIPFVNVAGLGLSTEINLHVSKWLKRHLGVLAFMITALQMVFKMNPFRAFITVDKKPRIETKSWQISVCNGKHYGAGMTIKHDATLDDNKLHCLSTEVEKWWQGFFLVKAFMQGRYEKGQDLKLVEGCEMKIETIRKFKIDVDGDIKTQTPAVFKVLPKSLKLWVPAGEKV